MLHVFVGGIIALLAGTAAAQGYPAKPIRFIVPFPPGGGTDIVARTVATKLTETKKWAIVLENKPGAGGNLGIEQAVKSPPDGYTMVIGQTSNLAINPTLHRNLSYDPLRDLAPVALMVSAPIILVTSDKRPFKSVAEVVAAAKAKPGQLSYASPGNGTVAHLTAELFQRAAGIQLSHIPYKGASQAMTDLMGGQVDLYLSSVPSAIAQIKGGKLRALAVTGAKRSAELPEVPAIAESGYKGFEVTTWYGLLLPAGTPEPIVKLLNGEVNQVLRLPEVRSRLAAEGGDVLGGTPGEFAAVLKADLARWGGIVKQSGAKVD
ncbi:MAG TPA: tripartite tricarboxylate transporter substrate binding protein [Burkholderiales bacterium]|jgi:tripartite-type tricarboxylate transporter receptor subunit TctC|nr:tripartite tricarboxylate transporter substrate binding protein [Burkholderiales bacterium]